MANSTQSSSGKAAPETQFRPTSDAGETLWIVEAIVDERGPRQEGDYLIKWAGTNPETGKAWEPSWEPKGNCMDACIQEWKEKKRNDPLIVGREGEKLARRQKEALRKEKRKRNRSSVSARPRKRGKGTPGSTSH